MGTIDDYQLHESVSVACQLRTLAELRRRTAEAVARGVCPVVEIDLDLCALRPVFRTAAALRMVGAEFSIAEFVEPQSLPVLPGYSDEAWLAFVEQLRLVERYPGLRWVEGGRPLRTAGTPFARFHELYWTTEWLREDEPTPGLGGFVQAIEALGGRVVFLSGRWLDAQIAPSREALRRAGIAEPRLWIGNPWHETLVPPGERPLSDAAVKAWRQARIVREVGLPIAIIDDRQANRAAVAACHPHSVASVAIAIPGFTVDAAARAAPLRLSTFEHFSQTTDSPPVRPHMAQRYPGLGHGAPWRGEYAGLGKNGLPYLLPRVVPWIAGRSDRTGGMGQSVPSGWSDRTGSGPFAELAGEFPERTGFDRDAIEPPVSERAIATNGLSERALLDAAERTIPLAEVGALRRAFEEARRLAELGLAAPWPETDEAERSLWYSLVCAWLHSRDLEVLMEAIGFHVAAAGQHDLREYVDAREVRHLLLASEASERERLRRANYSDWIVNWARQLADGPVNVSFLNPSLLVDLCQWSPRQTKPQDAMDVHRLSDHHDGDGAERFDPIEAGINNLLHQREGRDGVRKEPVVSWAALREEAATETGASELSKNTAARQAVRDAIAIAPRLERAGWLTPWSWCEASTPQ